jgi:hypothetical protein
MGKSGSPPAAPNYSQAAKDTQAASMTNQYTPYGSQVYSPDISSPSGFQSNISLNPTAQSALDSQMGLSSQMGALGQAFMPSVQQQYSQPMELGSVPEIADKAYGAMTSRLDPQWNQRDQMQRTQLANQGLSPGGEAYTNSMRDFGNQRNDAYQQANLAAIQTMPQTYQLANAAYNQPLNTLNALRSGTQVQNPQFSQQPGANYSQAAQNQGQYAGDVYNAEVGSSNSTNQGLMSLAGTAATLMMMY